MNFEVHAPNLYKGSYAFVACVVAEWRAGALAYPDQQRRRRYRLCGAFSPLPPCANQLARVFERRANCLEAG
jgi:hypothetical protein